MTSLSDRVIPIEPVQVASKLSPSSPAPAYQAAQQPAGSPGINRSAPAIRDLQRPSAGPRIGRSPSALVTLTEAKPHAPTAPSLAYLNMILSDLQAAVRTAEALRQTIATAEPSAAYTRIAAKAYSLEMRAQEEIRRLRAEGIIEALPRF